MKTYTDRKLNKKSGLVWTTAIILLICVLITLLLLSALYISYIRIRKPDSVVTITPFNVSDGNGNWSSDTHINLFKASYENGEGFITAKSADGDAIIAPGTSNSYLFHIQNGTNQAVNCISEIMISIDEDANGIKLPFKVRLSDENGEWLVGDEETYVDCEELNNVYQQICLNKNRYSVLLLEWIWPFDSDDAIDTFLGDLSASVGMNARSISAGVNVNLDLFVTATYAEEPLVSQGLSAQNNKRWILPLTLSILGIVLLLIMLWLHTRQLRTQGANNAGTPIPNPDVTALSITEAKPCDTNDIFKTETSEKTTEKVFLKPVEPKKRIAKPGRVYEINISELCEYFKSGSTVTVADMKACGLIPKNAKRVKVLAYGGISKPLIIRANGFSQQAIKEITLAGGRAEYL